MSLLPRLAVLLVVYCLPLGACGSDETPLASFLDRVHDDVLLGAELPDIDREAQSRSPRDSGSPHAAALAFVARLRAQDSPADLAGLAEALQVLDHPALAAEAWMLAAERDDRYAGADSLIRRADLLRNAKDFEGSRHLAREYREVAEGRPAQARSHLLEGLAYQDEVRLEEAMACYQRAGELDPDDPAVWLKRGQVHALRGETDTARQWFEKVLQLAPKDRQASFDLGRLSIESGDLDRGVELLEQVVQQDPRHRRAVYQLANAYRRLDQSARADQLLERFERLEEQANAEHANRMGREAVTILLEKARQALEKGDGPAARETLQQLLAIDPKNAAAHDLLQRASRKDDR